MSQAEGTRAESIEEQERDRAADKKPKSRRPANTAFRQQRLKAWQPILTPKSVLPLFFIVGILFAPIGGVLLWASAQVCFASKRSLSITPIVKPRRPLEALEIYRNTCPQHGRRSRARRLPGKRHGTPPARTGSVLWSLTSPSRWDPPVYMYYRLTNFYQNHRRYVQSLDLDQLKGTPVSNSTIAGSVCSPLATSDSGKAYYPCGLIANSMFNDTIGQPILTGDSSETYNMTTKGIAWQSDKDLIKTTKYKPGEVDPPPNWVGYNYTESIPDLHENEEFMVWMRTAGLPAFSKLSRRNDDDAMKPGRYELSINYRFNVTEYAGTKSILLSTRTALGGKNPFMGIAYVVVGGVCVLLGALFTVAHLVRPRKLGDHTYLTWDSTNQPSTATATGRDDRMRAGA
ncbi:Meiotically protein [Penicillium atrosanguineum]|nr:Meiotically protein [Penicillium atrosanguineum]